MGNALQHINCVFAYGMGKTLKSRLGAFKGSGSTHDHRLYSSGGVVPGWDGCLDSWPANCPYLVSLILLVVLLDFFIPRTHLLDCLPVHLCMVCRRQALPAESQALRLLLGISGTTCLQLVYRLCESL